MLRSLVLWLVLLLPLAASAKSPLDTLKATQTKLDKILSEAPAPGTKEASARRSKLEAEARAIFDIEELSRRALGTKWETGSPAQQTEFVELFSILVRGKYLDQAEGNSSKGFSLSWEGESLRGEEATVTATVEGVTAEGKPVKVAMQYQLIQRGDGWKVFDVVTDDASLAATYKDTFASMFKKEGDFAGVLVKLRAKTGRKAPAPQEPAAAAPVAGLVAPPSVIPKPAPAPAPKLADAPRPVPGTKAAKPSLLLARLFRRGDALLVQVLRPLATHPPTAALSLLQALFRA